MPEEKDLAHVEERLRAINTFAPIIRTQRSQVSVDQAPTQLTGQAAPFRLVPVLVAPLP